KSALALAVAERDGGWVINADALRHGEGEGGLAGRGGAGNQERFAEVCHGGGVARRGRAGPAPPSA
ncbi:MAG: tRNA (adenosine(37)-N6)-dimethylallyltransferase MiaA, partial [Pseudomonadota bacterium]